LDLRISGPLSWTPRRRPASRSRPLATLLDYRALHIGPATRTGTRLESVVPSPSAPLPLYPQQ